MEFNCTACGACCKKAGELGLMPSGKDGACVYLGEDNLCSIYDKRPDRCNIDKMYSITSKATPKTMRLTKAQYFKMQNKACNILQEGYKIDKKYRVAPEIYNKEGI